MDGDAEKEELHPVRYAGEEEIPANVSEPDSGDAWLFQGKCILRRGQQLSDREPVARDGAAGRGREDSRHFSRRMGQSQIQDFKSQEVDRWVTERCGEL